MKPAASISRKYTSFESAGPFAYKRTAVLAEIEVDDNEPPAGSKRLMNRGQHLLRVLEVVVSRTDERHICRTGGQVRRLLGAPNGLHHLFQATLAGLFSNGLEECRRDLHGVDRALRSDFLREHPGEQTRPRADVGHGQPRTQVNRLDDCLPLGEDFPRIRLEPLNKLLNIEIRVLELPVQIGCGVILVVLLS